MTKLITKKELEYLIRELDSYLSFSPIEPYYHKLLDSYKYYKDRTIELELQIEDLVNRDFDL